MRAQKKTDHPVGCARGPIGDTIDNIHKKWFGAYDLLEEHHGYIQWIFPIRYRFPWAVGGGLDVAKAHG